MAAMTVDAELVKAVITATSSLEPFPVLPFMQRLYDKARSTSNVAAFKNQLPLEPQYGPEDGLLIDNVDQTALLSKLATQCIVKGVASLDDGTDKPGFRACVNGTPAIQAIDSDILSMTSLLFAEHINWHLSNNKDAQGKPQPVSNLDQLRKTPGFVAAFSQELTDPKFVTGEIYQDMAQGNHIFSTALLFIAQYIHDGPGFTGLSTSAFTTSPARNMLTQWASELVKLPDADLSKVFSFITHVASGILLPDPTVTPLKASLGVAGQNFWRSARPGQAVPLTPPANIKSFPIGALSRTVLESVFQPATNSALEAGLSADRKSQLDSLTQSDIVEYQSIAAANQAQWEAMADRWLKAVGQAANAQTQSTRTENDDFGHGFAEGLSFGIAGGEDIYVTTITGQTLADWISTVRGANPTLFTSNTPNTVQVDHHKSTPAGNCFVAGTKVATDHGEVNIEAITEGTRILTEATAGRYGVASDEDVVTPSAEAKVPLVGFNNEGVFASLGHIFLTTTGPRALEPQYAMRENSFADVGRLRQGNALYRLSKDRKSYDVVTIESIQVQFVPVTHLYGVHLREGDRSYHANGYHVAINYPEITIKSIARALSQLPRHQAVKALQQIGELAPVFKKIGVPGVATLLKQELRDHRRHHKVHAPLGSTKKRYGGRRYQGLNFKDLKRTFALEARDSPLTDKNGPDGYKLPLVSVQEGVLHLDHDIVPRVAFNTKDMTLRWSRPLSTSQHYEHGVLNFTTHGLVGHGAVFVSKDENPAELPDQLDTVIPFVARKATSADVHALSTAQMHSTAPEPVEAAAAAPAAAAPATATTNLLGIAPISAASVSRVAVTTPAAAAASPLVDPGTIDQEDFYDVVVDTADWPAKTVRTLPITPVSMGQIAMATYHSDGKGGLAVPIIVVPTLDTLLADINKKQTATSKLGDLYRSTVLVNKTGTLSGTVIFASAANVALLSDQAPKSQTDPLPTTNLTFTKLGSAVKIPILYQSAEFSFSWDFSDISGALYEFDPSTVGNTGKRHWFGTSSSPAPATLARAAFAVNSATARTTAHTVATTAPVPDGTHVSSTVAAVTAKPAPVTQKLTAAQPLSVTGIANIPGYSEDSVHKQSQTLLQNMMYYHMNDSDRTTFLSYPKPQNLPDALAAGLDSGLKTWIHDTYAPAYVSFMLSQVAPGDSKGWRVNFDETEKNKIWYWWSGSGAKCLSKQTQYNTLNELTSRQAMIDLYGKTITPYLAQGDYWAGQLLTGWTKQHALAALLRQPINDANVNLLNMYCNILHTLSPKTQKNASGKSIGEYSDQLFQAVISYAQSIQADATASVNDPTGEVGREWLYDAMNTLIISTLNNDPSLDGTVRNDLLKDLNALATDMGIAANTEATEKARLMVAQLNVLIANMAGWMTKIGKGLSALWGLSGFSLAGTVFQRAADATKTISPGKIALAKGCSILALTAVYTFAAVNSFMQWTTLTTTGKSQAILITLKMVTDVAQKSFEAWAEYKKPTTTGAPKTVAQEQLNQGMREKLASEDGQKANLELSGANSGEKNPQVSDLVNDSAPVMTGDKKVESNSITGEAESEFNEKLPEVPAVGGKGTAWSRFNTPANWLRAVGIAISVALVIVMSISLAQNWNSLNDTGKALSTLQIITTGLSIAVDVAMFAGEMALMETAMFVTVLPIVGAVLAVIGLVVCVLMMVLGITKHEDPPPTPVETFITNTKPAIAKWDAMPQPALSYIVPLAAKPGAPAAPFSIIASNTSGADVTRTSIRVTLQGGSDPSCLFSDTHMADQGVKPGGAAAASSLVDGQVAALAIADGPEAAKLAEALTANQRGDSITSWDAVVQGVVDAAANPTGSLVLKGTGGVKQGFVVSFCGAINKAGSTVNTSVVQIVEVLTNGDSCRALFTVTRQ